MVDSTAADRNLPQSIADRLFLAVYFGSHKLPAGVCFLLRAADVGIRSVVVGLWLGVLTPRLLQKLDMWYYTRGFAATYRDKDYNKSGLFDWEQPVIETYFSKLLSVLVAPGAGAGREMLVLNRMGIHVDGYEYNPDLVRLGNALLSEDGWRPSIADSPANGLPPADLTPKSTQYEGAIVGWGTYTLIAGSAVRISLLKEIRSRCSPGAPILLSFFHRSGNSPSYRITAMAANFIRTLLRRSRVEIGDTLSVTYAHYFTEQEIANELSQSGFQLVSFKSQPYGHAVGIAV